jgi:integrase
VSRSLHRLSSAKVANAKPKKLPDGALRVKLYPDGGGLYLQVTPSKDARVAKSWIFRFTATNGKERYMGLGPLDVVGLADAREKATECRKLRYEGLDPIEHRHAVRDRDKLEAAKAITFKECATAYIKAHRVSWKHPKHARQWQSSLESYVYPMIGDLSVSVIDTAMVMKIIEPLWPTKTETMSRVRGRIESVLDWAKARKYRTGENPALWRGHLDKLLPAQSKVRKRGHYTAMPYVDVPAFMVRLRKEEGVAARALEFLVLTAVRLSDVVGSERDDRTPILWEHVSTSIWTIPATKNESEHRVPLCDRAIAILRGMKGLHDRIVFPEINDDSIRYVLSYRLKVTGKVATVHGFRSSFKDWAAEVTDFVDWVSEKALAHTIGDETRQAYQRGDLFEKRRKLMDVWAEFCG